MITDKDVLAVLRPHPLAFHMLQQDLDCDSAELREALVRLQAQGKAQLTYGGGWSLTKPGEKSYAEELAETVAEFHGQEVRKLGRGIPASTFQLLTALQEKPNGEVFIELDRNVIQDLQSGNMQADDLLPYLYPVAVRFDDEGDVVIHITDGERGNL